MRPLLVTQDFPPGEGGMARYYGDLAAGFPPGEIVVSATAAVGPAHSPAGHIRIERQPFPLRRAHRPLERWRWERALDRLAQSAAIDAVVCGNIRPLGPACQRLARRLSRPGYLVVHGNDLLAARRRWSGLRRGVWDRLFGELAGWIANSRAVLRLGVEECGLSPARAAVIPPAVDTNRFRPPSPEEALRARASFGLPNSPVVLFVGRLVTRKGLDRLIEALPAIPGAQLAVAGYGDDSAYRRLAANARVLDRVTFLGPVADADLPRLYQAADIVAMPSRTIAERGDVEGFGIVYLEAAATGRPALAGRSGGAPEAVLDGTTGRVVDGDSPEAIAEGLRELIEDEPRRQALGAAARRRVELEFQPGSMARKLIELLARGSVGSLDRR